MQPRQLAPIALTKSLCIYMHIACQTYIVYIQMLTMKLDSEYAIVCTLIPQTVLFQGILSLSFRVIVNTICPVGSGTQSSVSWRDKGFS